MYVFGGGVDGNVSHGDGFAYMFSRKLVNGLAYSFDLI